MKVLIIGKTGQLGSELLKILNDHDLLAPELEQFDISNYDQVKKYVLENKPEVIINTAAFNNVPLCEVEPYLAMRINWLSVKNLAEVSRSVQARIIHFSTNYVFDGEAIQPYEEDSSTNPLQIYGLSKLAGEESVMKIDDLNAVIIRTSVVFGGKGSPEKNNGNFIIGRIKDLGMKKLEVDKKQKFSITYAYDLAKAIKKIMEEKIVPGIYHVVNEGKCSWYELTEYIFKSKGANCELIPVDRKGLDGKLKRPIYTVLSSKKVRSLGIKLPPWDDAVHRYMKQLEEIKL